VAQIGKHTTSMQQAWIAEDQRRGREASGPRGKLPLRACRQDPLEVQGFGVVTGLAGRSPHSESDGSDHPGTPAGLHEMPSTR